MLSDSKAAAFFHMQNSQRRKKHVGNYSLLIYYANPLQIVSSLYFLCQKTMYINETLTWNGGGGTGLSW